MTKSAFRSVYTVVALSLLGLGGCYSGVEVSDSGEKLIAIDLVEPLCAEPGSDAGYIEGNGFGAENVTVTVGGIEAEVLAATGKDASFIVPAEGLSPGELIEVVVMNPGGRLATINWVVCEIECDPTDCDDGNECTTDTCDPSVEECVHTPVGDGAACDYGSLPGVCIAGQCEEDPCENLNCDDGDPCTDDSCDPLDGSCAYVNICGDSDPPVLTDFDINPTNVDVSSGPANVTYAVSVTDSPAGVDRVFCAIQNPTGTAVLSPIATSPSSGDRFNGVFECVFTLPQGASPGVWTVLKIDLYDTATNAASYYVADLQALGFPTELTVTYGSGSPSP